MSTEPLALYELTAEERRLAMMAYGCSYEWACEYADPLDSPESTAESFARSPWLLMGYERDTPTYTSQEQRIIREWFLAGINAGLRHQEEISRCNHALFARTVQGFVSQGALTYRDLDARRKQVVA